MTIHRPARISGFPGVGIRATTLAGTQHRTWSFAHRLESPRNDPANQPWRAINPLFAAMARRERSQTPAQLGIGLQLPGCTGTESGGWECGGADEDTPSGSGRVVDSAPQYGVPEGERTVRPLGEWLMQMKRGNPRERSEAMESVFRYAMHAKREGVRREDRQTVFAALTTRLSAEPDHQLRMRLLVQLVKLDDNAAIEPLARCMRSDSLWSLRAAAARGLATLPYPAAEQHLRAMRDAPWLAQWSQENQEKMEAQRVIIADLKANPEIKHSGSLQKVVREAEHELRVLHDTATAVQQFAEVVYGGVLKHEARGTARAKEKVLA